MSCCVAMAGSWSWTWRNSFHASHVTIRKDLDILHLRGLIHRTHGGALPKPDGALEDPTLREKEKLHRKEKMQIAAAAVKMVSEGQVVILDSGTTTTAIARALRNFTNLMIITNAVNIAAELSGSAVEVILSGGNLRKNSFSLVGPIAEETLHKLHAVGVNPRVMRDTTLLPIATHGWRCWTATLFLSARRLLVSGFAGETCCGTGEEDHERKPQRKENNLEDSLASIEEPIPGKRKYCRGKELGFISRHSTGVTRVPEIENPILQTSATSLECPRLSSGLLLGH